MNNEPKIYVASKTYHAPLWQEFRKLYNITSTWIDEAGEGQSTDLKDLAHRCVREVQECDVMIVYAEEGDYLKGAFIEMGVALASNKPVILVNTVLKEGSVFTHLPNVRQAQSLQDAFLMTESMEWLDESAPVPFEEVLINKPTPKRDYLKHLGFHQGPGTCTTEQTPRTGRIHYGGHRQHTVHYVIADDTNELIKVSEVSRKIAGDRLVEKQRQMKKDGYEGPFGLPCHCFTHGQTVSFTVDEAGEAVILFDEPAKAQGHE